MRVWDTFSRANSATTMGNAESGQAWTALVGTWGIDSGRAYRTATANGSNGCAIVNSGLADCDVEVQLAVAENKWPGLTLRCSDVNNLWFLWVNTSNQWILYKRVAGAALANPASGQINYTSALANGDWLRVRMRGSVFSVYHNGTLAGVATDSFNASATKHGLRAEPGNLERYDNFRVRRI